MIHICHTYSFDLIAVISLTQSSILKMMATSRSFTTESLHKL